MAIKANIIMDQGSTFETVIDLTDQDDDTIIDLTDYSGRASMRKHFSSNTSYNFVVTILPLLGQVTLYMSANNTANIEGGRYMYDCELEDLAGNVSRIVEGIVTVTPQVSR